MNNWFDIVRPHEDIREGDFDEAVFAADLADVALGRAAPDYNDPRTFLQKTYLTKGLEGLLHLVHDKLTKGKGASVLELKTPFGGGKTHALVLVYHYVKNGKQIKDLLPDGIAILDAHLSAIVGTQLNPAKGVKTKNVHRRTLWGEMAFQLGGEQAFEAIATNDKDRVTPGKSDLVSLLEARQPFILLFDEILEYVVKARGVGYADTSLGAQTLAFFNELTEAVAGIEHGMMIVTLPSSLLEDFGDAHQHNLAQLEKVFGRIETIVTPVHGEEVYSIIRRRLFEPAKNEAAIDDVVAEYVDLYRNLADELPPKAKEADYGVRLGLAYPIHPDLVDILYEKWGTFQTFQRTRGVLRLLANVVEDLYQRELNLDLILPGDVNFDRPSIRQEFLKHIGPEYEGIVGSDIAGVEAKSQILDRANKDWKHLAERNATAVFLHSFAADDSEKGVGLPYVKLAVARPGTIAPLITEVLHKQSNELWYLNTKGERYYFSSVPNLNRMILDKKEIVANGAPAELRRRVQGQLGTRMKCFLWPLTSDEVPNNRELKLVVLDPKRSWGFEELGEWVERKGDDFRIYKNTIFFAVPDPGRYARLDEEIKEYLALDEIFDEIEADERPGMQEKVSDVKRRKRDLEEVFPLRVKELYRTAAVPMAEAGLERIDLGQPAIGKENLDTWYWNELSEESRQKIMTRPPSANFLKSKFLRESELINTAILLEQFYKDTGMQVPGDPAVIAQAVASAVESGELGLGKGTNEEIDPETVRLQEFITANDVQFSDDEFLLNKALASRLKGDAVKPDLPKPPIDEGNGPGPKPIPTAEETLNELSLKASGIPSARIADLHRGVFLPLSKAFGEFQFDVELSVSSEEGISRKNLEQQVLETLRQLGAEFQIDEVDE